MILDRLENQGMYRALGPEIAMALDYLCRTDFSQVADGRYELAGDRVYAMVFRYPTKPLAEAQWEAHRQYTDVQYVARGTERMGYTSLRGELVELEPYDPQKDFVLYDAKGDLFEVREGSFAIFTPQDIHSPGLAIGPSDLSGEVRKVVVKCRV